MTTNLSRRIITYTIVTIASSRIAAQPAPPTSYPYDHPIGVTPAMIIIFATIVVIFFLMVCLSIFGRNCTGYNNGPADNRAAVVVVDGLDPAVVGSFPAFVYSEVKGLKIGKGTLECAVCISEFEDTDTLRLLPKCCHVFHQECIDTWLGNNVTCPVCRAMLVPRPGETTNFVLPVDEPEEDRNSCHTAEDDIIIEITEIQSPETANGGQTSQESVPPRSTSRRNRLFEKFKRSFTTGHVVVKPVRPEYDYTRFTLRLPEDARNRLVSRNIRQSATLPRVESKRNGYRSASVGATYGRSLLNYERFEQIGRPDRWRFTGTLTNFSSTSSGRSPRSMGKEISRSQHEGTSSKSLSRSVKSSFQFGEDDSIKEDVKVGERSFDRLRFDCNHV